MNKFSYDGFACVMANEDEIDFSNGRGEINVEYMSLDCVPMRKYNFFFTESEDGDFKVSSFEKDKFDKFFVKMKSENQKGEITIAMHIDSYKASDMESFKLGTRFKFDFE